MKKGTKLLIAVLSLLIFFFVSNRVSALSIDEVQNYVKDTQSSAIAYIDSGLPNDGYHEAGWYAFAYDLTDSSIRVGQYRKASGKDTYELCFLVDSVYNIKYWKSAFDDATDYKTTFHNRNVPIEVVLKDASKDKIIEDSNYSAYKAADYGTNESEQNGKSTSSDNDVNAVATIENISLEEAKKRWSYQTDVFVCNKTSCDVNGDGVADDVEYSNYYYKFIDGDTGKIHLVDTGRKITSTIKGGSQSFTKDKIIDIKNIGTSEGTTNPCKYLFGDVTDKNSAAYLIQSIFNYMKFIGIVLAVIMTIVDLTKAVAGGNMEDEMKKIGPKSIKRIAYAILIFLLPTIINVVFKIFGLWGTCNIS